MNKNYSLLGLLSSMNVRSDNGPGPKFIITSENPPIKSDHIVDDSPVTICCGGQPDERTPKEIVMDVVSDVKDSSEKKRFDMDMKPYFNNPVVGMELPLNTKENR